MDTKSICPSCQKPLAPDVPMGLCPECLIKAGFPTGGDTETGARSAFTPPTVEAIAKLFPQLEVLELIGKGGMGAVYKARQKRLNRFVALKILPPGIGQEPAFAERFTREAQALAQLNHPGIVTLYEFGETEGQFYFLMEFVDGVNLRQLLANSRVSTREALAIVPQICDALQFAHDQGIVHRDIKPENILMDRRGRVKVADFGLAKIIGSEATSPFGVPPSGGPDRLKPELQTLTDAGKVMGTPQYMSPEQIQAPGEVDHRADIYALGVVFYQMLTGELPGKRFVAPSSKVQIDVRLDEVVLRALEKNPALRYQQVSEVKTLVETIVATPPGSSRREEAQTENSESGKPDEFSTAMAASEDKSLGEHIIKWCWIILTSALAVLFIYYETGSKLWTYWKACFAIVAFASFVEYLSRDFRKRSVKKAAIENPKSEMVPHFSQTAIVGAAWAVFALISAIQILAVRHISLEALNASVWWRVLNLFGQPVLALTAVPGTTMLGWMAVSQIRRSAGKLHGLWLAVFDGLLFPLLALDALIVGAFYLGLLLTAKEWKHFHSAPNGIGIPLLLLIPIVLGVVALADFFIIRHVWRAVNKRGAGVPPAAPARRSYPGKQKGIGLGGSVLIGVVLVLLLLVLKVHHQLSTIDQIVANPSGEAGTRELSGPPFVARLHQAEVELVAVGNQPWTNPVCWLPNGTLSGKPFPSTDMTLNGSSENREMKKIAFRIRNESANEISYPVCRVNEESGVSPQGSGWQPADPYHPDDGYYQTIACPTNVATMNVSLGLANGAWETAITLRHDNGLGGAESFASPTEGKWSATYNAVIGQNDVAINCNYTKSTNWASRMVAVNEGGKITVIPENSSSVSTLSTGGILLVSSNEFAQIKEFQLQRRKYQWAEFRNVALQPGLATSVTVKENIVKPVATIQPSAQPTKVAPPFDTVIECVVTNAFSFATGGQSQVAWADGKRLELSWGASGMDKEKFLREHDIDLFTDDGRGLYGIDVKVTSAAWSPQISAEQIAGQLQSSNRYTLYGLSGVCFTTPGTTPAYWFETRTGRKGILQITGFTENPRGVKIRYKLMQNTVTTATPVSMPPAAAPHLSFGPVIERLLIPFDDNPAQACLDLGSGEYHSPSTNLADGIRRLADHDNGQPFSDLNTSGDERCAWLKASGVDLIGGLGPDGHAEFKYIGQPPTYENGWTSFDRADPKKVVQMLQASPFYAGDQPNLPAVYVNAIKPQLESVKNAKFILFRTHDGDVGIFQVLGESQNPRGVKIRYKLVQNIVTTATPVSLPPVATPDLAFGPVIERTLSADPGLPPTFLRLHDGSLVFPPTASKTQSAKAFADWWRSTQADFMAAVMEKKHLLVTLENDGAKFAPIQGDKWDSATVAELADSLKNGTSLQAVGEGGIISYVLPEPVLLPATFAVESRTGETGLLQITGFAENPRGVKLRYKLVQSSAQPAPDLTNLEQQIRTGLEYEPVVWCKDAMVRSVYLDDTKRRAVVVMDDPEIGRQNVVLKADDAGLFEGSLHGPDKPWWYPIAVLPADSARLEAEYRALPAGDAFEPDCELAVLRPADVAWCLLGIDFDTGKTITVPNDIAGKPEDDIESLRSQEVLKRWALEHHVDAFARFTTNELGFTFFDTPTHLLYLTKGWQRLKPDRIKRAFVSGKLPGSGRLGDKLTNYFDNGGVAVAFRTHENRLGAWRIGGKLGDPLNPRGVKIRYKLVQADNTAFAKSPAPTNAPAAEKPAGQAIARLKLQQAELAVKDAELKFSVGTLTEYELKKVKLSRDIAAAEVKGDPTEVARLTLAVAELDLDVVGKKVAFGLAPQSEYDQAKLARDSAAARYKLAQSTADPSHR